MEQGSQLLLMSEIVLALLLASSLSEYEEEAFLENLNVDD